MADIVDGTPAFIRRTCLLVSPGLTDLTDGKTIIPVTNLNEYSLTKKSQQKQSSLRIPILQQAAKITPMPIEHLNLMTQFLGKADKVIRR